MFNHALEPPRMAQRVGSLRRSARHHLRIVSPRLSAEGAAWPDTMLKNLSDKLSVALVQKLSHAG
jgi:hypothetical protein